ncbi:MAG: deoxyribodipyrimidine photolyase [Pirellulales bacterium]
MSTVPTLRVQPVNSAETNPSGEFVLYWMIAHRRGTYNFGLQRAVEWARGLKKPLVILEALRVGYHWASDRIHRFVIDGMEDNACHFEKYASQGVTYLPYVEPKQGAGTGLLETLAKKSCLVVTDDFPCFFLPAMVQSVAKRLTVRIEAIDSNGILPIRAAGQQVFSMAFHFRRWLQKNLLPHLQEDQFPQADPLVGARLPTAWQPPANLLKRWPLADLSHLRNGEQGLANLPIDHDVRISPIAGGPVAAQKVLKSFLQAKLSRYATDRNIPDDDVASGLSPYLHFGHVSVHEVFQKAAEHEKWKLTKISGKPDGKNSGWWGGSAAHESFLDELITWREIGYNFTSRRRDYDQFESLPEWAQETLLEHAKDRRSHIYTLEDFEKSRTHDPLWNAAQRQLVREGKIHNYLRMLWGKKILEWTKHPKEALAIMIELNNKYALDGRNPNSYSGIFWVLGRYDRAWGPERPIYGTIRYMTSENTARKVSVKGYLRKYGAERSLF